MTAHRTYKTSEQEKDRIALMVLEVVSELTRGARLPAPVVKLEPTSTGYLPAEVRPYVMKRSA